MSKISEHFLKAQLFIGGSWLTQSRWMNCPPSKNGTGAVMGAGSLKPFFPAAAAAPF
jgi:hypothetical protein